jgi:hypothetical protein
MAALRCRVRNDPVNTRAFYEKASFVTPGRNFGVPAAEATVAAVGRVCQLFQTICDVGKSNGRLEQETSPTFIANKNSA